MKPQRYLAAAGFGSRRACEQLIKEGRVTVNGAPVTFNLELSDRDNVEVDHRPARLPHAPVYIALHKPAGYVSDRGARGATSALDLVDAGARLFAVGRLDADATGLLLLTNDGELAHQLTHPRFEHDKEYRVLVEGHPGEAALAQWRQGVMLDGETRPTAPADVRVLEQNADAGGVWLQVTLREGRKRQIKRVAKLIGHPVRALIRTRIGPLHLGTLALGTWRTLTAAEVAALKRNS